MRYKKIVKGKFISRPNRFVAVVEINGKECHTHVKNTGRCRELLVEGATVYLENFTEDINNRKYAYSLIAVEKRLDDNVRLINMDSQAPNKVVKEALENGSLRLPGLSSLTKIKPEAVYGKSRLDFYVCDENGREGYIEVKGVTLESNSVASFPDAPTERGIKHLNELSALAKAGINSYALFIIQMENISFFTANEERHYAFAEALRSAKNKGVHVLAYDCKVSKDSLTLNNPIEIKF